jgi:hypothetical protein
VRYELLREDYLPDYLAFEIRGLIFWISLTAEECLIPPPIDRLYPLRSASEAVGWMAVSGGIV